MAQIQDQRRPSRSYQNNLRNPNPPVCYNCRRTGHISHYCNAPRQSPATNNPPTNPPPNTPNSVNSQETLLALLNLIQQTAQPENQEEHPT
ncbi:7117_t:CDS:1, partial [Scutellospora calospora]